MVFSTGTVLHMMMMVFSTGTVLHMMVMMMVVSTDTVLHLMMLMMVMVVRTDTVLHVMMVMVFSTGTVLHVMMMVVFSAGAVLHVMLMLMLMLKLMCYSYIHFLGSYLLPMLMTFAWLAAMGIATHNLVYDRQSGQEEVRQGGPSSGWLFVRVALHLFGA